MTITFNDEMPSHPSEAIPRFATQKLETPAAEPSEADLDPVEFTRRRLLIEPDERQIEVLRSKRKPRNPKLLPPVGKINHGGGPKPCTRAYTRPKSLILLASPTERQSAEFLRKAADFVSRLGIRPRGDGDNTISLELPNGSRIVGLPGTEATVRGFSNVSLLLIDEAARVDDAMYKAPDAHAGRRQRRLVADEHALG